MLLDELGELEEGVFELLEIGGLLASVAIEDGETLDFVDHAAGVPAGEGDDAEGDVLEDFDHDAAEAEHEDGPELGVLGHADDDLRAGAGHALYGYAFDDGVRLVGLDGGDDVVVGGGGLGGVLEAELHAAHVALVDDVGGDDLEYDGVADAPGLLDGLFLRGGKGGLGSLDAGVAKHLLGLDFVEENAALVTGPVQGLALGHGGLLLLDAVMLGRMPWERISTPSVGCQRGGGLTYDYQKARGRSKGIGFVVECLRELGTMFDCMFSAGLLSCLGGSSPPRVDFQPGGCSICASI